MAIEFEDGVTLNLRRAAEERAKAADAGCDFERRWRLEIAAIFAKRAFGAAGLRWGMAPRCARSLWERPEEKCRAPGGMIRLD